MDSAAFIALLRLSPVEPVYSSHQWTKNIGLTREVAEIN